MNDQSLNRDYCANANLISTTDRSSYITHANKAFCDIAGYSPNELVGNPHNMVRHKDMPKQAFAQMWSYLKAGNSWMGLVKNQCNNEHHYWVSAFVTPITDSNGEITEYQSVRSKPSEAQIARADALYQDLRNDNQPNQFRLPLHKLSVGLSAASTLFASGAAIWTPNLLSVFIAAASLTACASMVYQTRRFSAIKALANEAYFNPLMEKPYTQYLDDYSQVELALLMKKAELRAVTARASETSGEILISAEDEFGTIQSIGQSLDQQCLETEQVATAVEELSHSIKEVSDAASAASLLAEEADQESTNGLNSIRSTIMEVNALTEELNEAQSIINRLSQDTQKIDSILEVITTISEQTNLLALNAAIEAARAGEAGRGFAVVADEVRNLASKTGSSASEIHTMIRQLQETSESAVNAMEKGRALSDQCKERADQTGVVLNTISDKLSMVTDSSVQIASAVEQQASVTQEINHNVVNIKTLAEDTSVASQTSIERTSRLVERIEGLERLMKQFEAK